MTCIIAAEYDDGVLVASDSLVSVGDRKVYLSEIKGFDFYGCGVYHAGPLDYAQKFKETMRWVHENHPAAHGSVRAVQLALWEFPPPKKERDEVEFLVVDATNIYTMSGHGDFVCHKEYAVAGSDYGWVGIDLNYPKVRKRTLYAMKKCLGQVILAVAKRDAGVAGPVRFEEL